ncbi:uncharacterized protein [Anoplolepis gracilipes]|uniref:uncharacterized protein n=1 Tax=Anoplolepis gracilipes TaxID=354296 RepID=UPI003BA36DED
MSRNCNNLNVSQPLCCLSACSTPCPVICCTPPVNFPCMPYVPRVQCRMTFPPQSIPKPTKAVVYLPPCPSCPMSNPPKMEVTYCPPPPPPPPCFYVCKPNCVPCIPPPCPNPIVMRSPSCKMLCRKFITIFLFTLLRLI